MSSWEARFRGRATQAWRGWKGQYPRDRFVQEGTRGPAPVPARVFLASTRAGIYPGPTAQPGWGGGPPRTPRAPAGQGPLLTPAVCSVLGPSREVPVQAAGLQRAARALGGPALPLLGPPPGLAGKHHLHPESRLAGGRRKPPGWRSSTRHSPDSREVGLPGTCPMQQPQGVPFGKLSVQVTEANRHRRQGRSQPGTVGTAGGAQAVLAQLRALVPSDDPWAWAEGLGKRPCTPASRPGVSLPAHQPESSPRLTAASHQHSPGPNLAHTTVRKPKSAKTRHRSLL